MNFLKSLLATLLGLTLFSIFVVVIFFGWVGVMTAEEEVVVKENSILHIKFQTPIAERTFEDPLANLSMGYGSTLGIYDAITSIKAAKSDENIRAIYIDIQYIMAGLGHIYELRQAIGDFKTSGKPVFAYSNFMSEGSYYLSSVADSIFLQPNGSFEFNGMTYNMTFFKETLDKLDMKAQIFKVGDFKSAVEPFERSDMSEENRRQVESFISDIHLTFLNDIAESRGIPVEELKTMSGEMAARNNKDAVELGLVDGLEYSDEVMMTISESLGLGSEDIEMISLSRYGKAQQATSTSANRVAVVVADGPIVFGNSDQGSIGSEKFVKELRSAKENSRVKAIVLRVNSPGGNFIASDDLWKEIEEAKAVKPVVASMSNYAASGGYYLAMGADTIVAYPNTITGSIGIYSMLFDMSGFLKNKLGITHDGVNTGKYSDMLTSNRPLTEIEKEIYQKSAQEGYDTFVAKAASGRGMSVRQIEEIASGRVWTGTQAIDNGLVDVLGDYDDAIEIAAEMAGIGDDYKLRFYPEQKTYWEQIIYELGGNAKVKLAQHRFGDMLQYLNVIDRLNEYSGVQARMPEIKVEF